MKERLESWENFKVKMSSEEEKIRRGLD